MGKTITEDPAFNFAFEFGVIDISEVGKERGNTLENKEMKKKDDAANPLNDLMNAYIKMCRHLATVDGFPFIRFICDEQRPETWGADARDLAKVFRIEEMRGSRLSVPMFHLEESFFDWVDAKFGCGYVDFRFRRGDYNLPNYLMHNFHAKIIRLKDRMYGKYGYRKQILTVEKGSLDGEKTQRTLNLVHKQVYSDRFSTDCYSDVFAFRTAFAKIGLDEMPMYRTDCASIFELAQQNSYFIRDLTKNLRVIESERFLAT